MSRSGVTAALVVQRWEKRTLRGWRKELRCSETFLFSPFLGCSAVSLGERIA